MTGSPGSDRTRPKWYSAVAWTLIAPVWTVGAFILAVGFLAVPSALLDGKSLGAWGANATSKGRALGPILSRTGPRLVAQWTRLGAATSRLNPFSRIAPAAKAAPATGSTPIKEAQA